MAWAQKGYNEIQGIKGRYRIAAIGCRLTADCNLLERFGRGVSPITLNAAYRDRGLYSDIDDGVRDDILNTTITKFDTNIAYTGSGTGTPPHANCIVKMPLKNNQFGSHFSLVHHLDGNTVYITDSWDGQVKPTSFYGNILRWDAYEDRTPRPAPSAPAPVIKKRIDGIHYEALPEPKLYKIRTPEAHVWDFGYANTWAELNQSSLGTRPQDSDFWVYGKAYHPIGAWYMLDKPAWEGEKDRGINAFDLKEYVEPVVVESIPVVEAPAEPISNDTYPNVSEADKAGDYIMLEDYIVSDLAGLQAQYQYHKGDIKRVVGTTIKGEIKYYILQKYFDQGWLYGVPENLMTPEDDDELFTHVDTSEPIIALTPAKQGLIKKVTGSISSAFAWAASFIVGFKKGKEK